MDQRAERAEIVVDAAAIRANARLLRATAGVPLIAVVKADGYGHGMVPAARAAREGGADWIATATQDEALALRAAGDTGPLLCWLAVPGEDYADAVAAGIDVTAYSVEQLDAIAAGVTDTPARVQLKVDTGLWRGGAVPADWPRLFERAREGERAGLWRITGIWSHFACSDEPDHPANDQQQAVFDDALSAAAAAGLDPEVRHLANSAATLLRPGARYDAVRCGIALYGQDPAPGHTADIGLRPAMTVRTHLAMVKHLQPGASVSYGHTWTADRPTTVGLVPLGYGDGVPRHASNLATVGVAGKRRPIRGRVCMDQFVVDLDGDDVAPGTEVVLFGEPDAGTPTAQDWAAAIDTINYEIVTRIGGTRVPRRWIDTDGAHDTHHTESEES
ncbi:alanine racemase [Nocardioides panacisoli]|uniref:alanine racemase n=1 Tax=Nocardioides panacisoli TaxID=627624 RepID=UPI001C635D51|nr:alanine racemase [Nocardioides panacisoli]QYJ02586.1 alanine racemase [Nocardioides panacisoli]